MALVEIIGSYQEFARSDLFKHYVHDVNKHVQEVIWKNNFAPDAPNEDISSLLTQIPLHVDDVLVNQHAKTEKVEHLTPEQAVTRPGVGFFSQATQRKPEETPTPPTEDITKKKP